MHRSRPFPFLFLLFGALPVTFLAGCAGTEPRAGSERAAGEMPIRRMIAPFEVYKANGDAYAYPFLGGFNMPRPQLLDIDADGDNDLFVQEHPNAIMFFERNDTQGPALWTWRSDKYAELDVGEWYRFADMDGDGDFDLLAEQPFSHMRYYKNVGTPLQADFVQAVDTLRDAEGEPVFSDRQNIPNVTDIDCDGMPDLFIGRIDGTVMRYEAVETEPAPVFQLVTENFEDIRIVAQFGQPGMPAPAALPNIPGTNDDFMNEGPSPGKDVFAEDTQNRSDPLHGANTMTFADIDGDNDQDLFWGDFFEPGLLYIENTGACARPRLRTTPVPFPIDDPLQSSGYNAPSFGDLDNDGDMDLLAGVLGGAFNPNRTAQSNLYMYEQLPEERFALRTTRFMDQIDVGSESYPVLVDMDADGDEDLLISNKISSEDGRTASLAYFENVDGAYRTGEAPAFFPAYHYAPAFADLDADGDHDLLLGTWNDGIAWYRNEGAPGTPDFVLQQRAYIRLTRGSHTTPALVDIDDDGDLDLFVGETSGTINFYRNAGTASAPVFEFVSDEYAGIDVGRRSVPTFIDTDRDGDLDMIVGSEHEGLLLFRNLGDRTTPLFGESEPLPYDVPEAAVPSFGDPDGDGALELMVGGYSGGLLYFDGP
ncbi:MAG: VCBS repeat-containing protein [Bacteroidetes bacterium SB0662_bin_6]|nr:VCBS repeat-containing protein [Bacteroidetes bacterium SB0668_bin_1]MYE04678.1 VCBS repeat-containing protein [Bacteroidetes bacterium SB0662_bin_6]